jgi:hypothetical protein
MGSIAGSVMRRFKKWVEFLEESHATIERRVFI